jgi:2-dehydropantoate 2-reductase
MEGTFRTVLLCVKAHHTTEAILDVAPHLAEDGAVVSIQNGLNELDILQHVGEERTIGAFVNFGADVLEPGVVHYGGRGAVVVGELDGSSTPRLVELVRLLQLFEPRAKPTGNIFGYLWGKLAYAAQLFATALTNEPIADVLARAEYRTLHVALAREVLAVADAEGITPEPFDGFDPDAFTPRSPQSAALASLEALVEFNRRSAKTHSGIWRDLAVRHRRTEVDAQLGPVVRIGERHGVPTPLTRRLIELVHQVENGESPQDLSTLDGLNRIVPSPPDAPRHRFKFGHVGLGNSKDESGS